MVTEETTTGKTVVPHQHEDSELARRPGETGADRGEGVHETQEVPASQPEEDVSVYGQCDCVGHGV